MSSTSLRRGGPVRFSRVRQKPHRQEYLCYLNPMQAGECVLEVGYVSRVNLKWKDLLIVGTAWCVQSRISLTLVR